MRNQRVALTSAAVVLSSNGASATVHNTEALKTNSRLIRFHQADLRRLISRAGGKQTAVARSVS